MSDFIVWFEIPVKDLDRAIKFYSSVLAVPVQLQHGESPMGILGFEHSPASGCLYQADDERIGKGGPVLYFNVSGRLDDSLVKVEANGGEVVQNKHSIGVYGYRAIVKDSEGNHIALHSYKE